MVLRIEPTATSFIGKNQEMSKVMTWLENIAYAWDEFLNVLLGGLPGQTFSMRAAVARQSGRVWGCVMCAMLAALIQREHCQKTLEGEAPTGLAAIRTGLALLASMIGFIVLVRLS